MPILHKISNEERAGKNRLNFPLHPKNLIIYIKVWSCMHKLTIILIR